MEIINHNAVQQNNSLLVITHLMQLLGYFIGFGSLIIPLILWLSSRNSVAGMDEHGRAVVNLQLSMLLYFVLSIPAILLLGLGILTLIGTVVLGFVLPIVNAVKASNGESPSYFLTIPFLQPKK